MSDTGFLTGGKCPRHDPRMPSAASSIRAGTCCAGRHLPPEHWAPPSCWPPAAAVAPRPPVGSSRRRPARCARWSPTCPSSRSWAHRACSPPAGAASRSGWRRHQRAGRGRQPPSVAGQGPDQPGAGPLHGPLAENDRLPANPRPLPPQPAQRLLPGRGRPAPAGHLAGGGDRGGGKPTRRRQGAIKISQQVPAPAAAGPCPAQPRWPPAQPGSPRSAPAIRSAPRTPSRWTRHCGPAGRRWCRLRPRCCAPAACAAPWSTSRSSPSRR